MFQAIVQMSEAIDLWGMLIEEGVAALDFKLLHGSGGALLLAEVATRELPANMLLAAHAAIEIDKLIGFEIAPTASLEAVQLRRVLIQAMSARHPSSDLELATAAVLDRYRIELALAVRRAAGDNPAERLAAIGSPHS